MFDPSEFTPERDEKRKRWQRNRDHCAGVDAVKEAGESYLPKPDDEMTDEQYANYQRLVEYFPAAARTLKSFIGLAFRKSPVLKAPKVVEDHAWAVTAKGQSVEFVSRWAMREFTMLNDGGLLVDYPERPSYLSKAQAEKLGLRPVVSCYAAESIREYTTAAVGGEQRPIRVRLLETPNRVRKLELVEGIYTVTIFEKTGDVWEIKSTTTPFKAGKTFDYIPFVTLSDETDEGAQMDDLCANNATHYALKGELAVGLKWIVAPIRVVSGVDKDVTLSVKPGSVWRFENEKAKSEFDEYKGDGIPHFMTEIEKVEEHMSAIGSRMLDSPKAAAEKSETLARRQAGENSILAMTTKHVASRVERAMEFFADWLGVDPKSVSFVISTDFIPLSADPQMVGQMSNMQRAGQITKRELFEFNQRNELINDAVTFEQHIDELEAETVDQPVQGVIVDEAEDDVGNDG